MCSFDECMYHAAAKNSTGFSYRGTMGSYCRLCDATDLENRTYGRGVVDWGIYAQSIVGKYILILNYGMLTCVIVLRNKIMV